MGIYKPYIYNGYVEYLIYLIYLFLISGIFHESMVFGLNLNRLKWIQIQMIVFAFGVFLLTPIGNYFLYLVSPQYCLLIAVN